MIVLLYKNTKTCMNKTGMDLYLYSYQALFCMIIQDYKDLKSILNIETI